MFYLYSKNPISYIRKTTASQALRVFKNEDQRKLRQEPRTHNILFVLFCEDGKIWMKWHCPPDTGFEIRALTVSDRARYLSVTSWLPHSLSCWFTIEQTLADIISIAARSMACLYNIKQPKQVYKANNIICWYIVILVWCWVSVV